MPRQCENCGKQPIFGHSISHAHNLTNRKWLPNLRLIRVRLEGGGTRRVKVCTRCLRSNVYQKAVN